jgi:hypothetical protein
VSVRRTGAGRGGPPFHPSAGAGGVGGSGSYAGDRARSAPPEGALGANFNEEPRGMTASVLDDLRTRWVRGFVAMPELDSVEAPRQPEIRCLPHTPVWLGVRDGSQPGVLRRVPRSPGRFGGVMMAWR